MRDEFNRQRFARFLDRRADDAEVQDEWPNLIVAHDLDEELEEVRRQLVRLSIGRNPWGQPRWTDSDRETIRQWASQLSDPRVA